MHHINHQNQKEIGINMDETTDKKRWNKMNALEAEIAKQDKEIADLTTKLVKICPHGKWIKTEYAPRVCEYCGLVDENAQINSLDEETRI